MALPPPPPPHQRHPPPPQGQVQPAPPIRLARTGAPGPGSQEVVPEGGIGEQAKVEHQFLAVPSNNNKTNSNNSKNTIPQHPANPPDLNLTLLHPHQNPARSISSPLLLPPPSDKIHRLVDPQPHKTIVQNAVDPGHLIRN